MSKKRTLQNQFYFALQNINLTDIEKRENVFQDLTGRPGEGVTKKDFKKEGISSKFVFSFSSMQNICSISKDFANYLQMHGITKANKITPSLARGFLNYKALQGASSRTLLSYKSALIKINNAITQTYSCKGFCRGEDNIKSFVVAKPTPIERRLTNNQVDQILQSYKGKYALPFMLQADYGLRINEIRNLSIYDFQFSRGETVQTIKQGLVNTTLTLHIHKGTKGGLERFVPIPLEKVADYWQIVSNLESKGIEKPFKYIDRSNYDKAIKNIAYKLGFGKVGSSHEFRKYFASSMYQKNLHEGMTMKEKKYLARDIVSLLGHGKCRDDLVKTYIGNL